MEPPETILIEEISHLLPPSLIHLCLLFLSILFIKILWDSYNDPLVRYGKIPIIKSNIPFFGSVFTFRKDPIGFIHRNGQDSGIFALKLMGTTTIVVVDASAAMHVINGKFPQITWRRVKFRMFTNAIGIGRAAAETIIDHNPFIHGVLDKHLMNTDSLDAVMTKYQKIVNERVLPSLLLSHGGKNHSEPDVWMAIPIMKFFGAATTMSTAEVLYGDPSFASERNYDLTLKYDEKFGELFIFPRFLAKLLFREAFDAREELVGKMRKVLSPPPRDRRQTDDRKNGDFSPLVADLETFDQDHEPTNNLEDRARHQIIVLHAALLNTLPNIFWIVYRLLTETEAYEQITREIFTIYNDKPSNEKNHHFTLQDLEGMVKLDSLVNEVIRLQTSHISIRNRLATKDFTMKISIKGKKHQIPVRKGNAIMTCATSIHRDPEVFTDPLKFKWDRFVPDESGKKPEFFRGGTKIRSPIVAFGGGPTYCPGRRFAKAEMKLWVARVLLEYDLRFKDGKRPGKEPRMMNLISGQSVGMPLDDVMVEFRRRDDSIVVDGK